MFNRDTDIVEVLNDIAKVFNNDNNDLINSLFKVNPEKDQTVEEVFWSRLMLYVVEYYYQNGSVRIVKREESNFYFYNLIDGNIKLEFDPISKKLRFFDFKEVNKFMVWREFLNFLKYNYKSNDR